MNSKRNCVSCGKRLTGSGKRPITVTSMRIFISARVYPSRLPNDGLVCDKCRWSYKQWMAECGFCQILLNIDSLQEGNDTIDEEFNERKNTNSSNVESDDQILDHNESDENDSNGADMDFNEKDVDGEIMDDNGSNENDSDGADMEFNDENDGQIMDENESDQNDSHDSSAGSGDEYNNISVVSKSTSTDRSSLKLTVEVAIASNSQCCVCRIQLNPPAVTVKKEDRDNMFVKRNIVIPKGSRCCKMHTVNGFLSHEAFSAITAYKIREEPFDFNHNMDTMQKLRTMVNSKKHINFDDGFSLSDLDYKNLTGFTRAQHDHILSYIPSSALKNSVNRSPRCSVACLLMKLKLGLSNSVLASMLGIDNKRKVSDIIHSARLALSQYFVPHYLGLAHISRQEIIQKHTSSIATRLLTENRNPCILVLDGTYFYIQKSRNNMVQRKTFNLYKNRSLVKPMVVVSTTGYIVAIFGPFFSDNNNNDASILKHIITNNYDDILNWIEENDILILDRGFRDSLGILKSLGIDVAMPSFLGPKQKQFDVQQANNSRFVTMLRWVVESVNCRIKRFKWFNQVIPNSSLPSIKDFMMITAALLNCFHTPMVNPSIDNDAVITRMNSLRTKSNELQNYLIDHQLTRNSVWDVIELDHVAVTFPKLSLDEIRTLTLGNSS
ncbi:unnamed protein product [Rotaria sp. Silwood2]|nr:unnamed protein product [Rotaria sp. Silwood2]